MSFRDMWIVSGLIIAIWIFLEPILRKLTQTEAEKREEELRRKWNEKPDE